MRNTIKVGKYGLNAALAICPRCGKDSNEILLLGKVRERECKTCHKTIVGKRPNICPHCKKGNEFFDKGEFDAQCKKIPGSLCKTCEGEIEQFRMIVEEGGVYFKCKGCLLEGVIKANVPLAQEVRRASNVAAPDLIGVEFEECEQHQYAEEVANGCSDSKNDEPV